MDVRKYCVYNRTWTHTSDHSSAGILTGSLSRLSVHSPYPKPPVYTDPYLGAQYTRALRIIRFKKEIVYLHKLSNATAYRTYRQDIFNNHTIYKLIRILVTENSVVGVMKIGINVPRPGVKHLLLAILGLSFKPYGLPYEITIQVYSAPCLRR